MDFGKKSCFLFLPFLEAQASVTDDHAGAQLYVREHEQCHDGSLISRENVMSFSGRY